MKNIRGEITTQQIVLLLILITSFAIILFLIFRLNLGETSDKQICHNSVVLKQKAVVGGELDCKTNYVCISGGGKCEGISPLITSKVKLGSENLKEEIMELLAKEIADCWWMFGEGEIKYGSVGKTSCAICSVVAFDEKILESLESDETLKITYRDFYNYLLETDKEEGLSYLNYLYGVYDVQNFVEKVSQLNVDFDTDLIIGEGKYDIITGVRDWKISLTYVYPYYVRSDKLSNLDIDCNDFVTQA